MIKKQSEKPREGERHHFLYHIFRLDKAENPMPRQRREPLAHQVQKWFRDKK